MEVRLGRKILVIAPSKAAIDVIVHHLVLMTPPDGKGGNRGPIVISVEAAREVDVFVTTVIEATDQTLSNSFSPDSIYVHDTCQEGEFEVVAMALSHEFWTQLNLYGDPKVSQPTRPCPDVVNEFSANARYSIMERLMDAGLSAYKLEVQDGMTEICYMITNNIFYDQKITTVDSMKMEHPKTLALRQFLHKHIWEESRPLDEVSEVLFVNIPHSTGYPGPHGASCVNYDEANAITEHISQLLLSEKDIEASDLGCLSFYKAQVEVMRSSISDRISQDYPATPGADEMNLPRTNDITIGTVNFFQNMEKNIMFFSLTKSGRDITNEMSSHMRAWSYVPAPMRDRFWLNVATSRQKYGLILYGNFDSLLEASLRNRGSAIHKMLMFIRDKDWIVTLPYGKYMEKNHPHVQKYKEMRHRQVHKWMRQEGKGKIPKPSDEVQLDDDADRA